MNKLKTLTLTALSGAALLVATSANALPYAQGTLNLSELGGISYTSTNGNLTGITSFSLTSNAGGFEFGLTDAGTGAFTTGTSTGFPAADPNSRGHLFNSSTTPSSPLTAVSTTIMGLTGGSVPFNTTTFNFSVNTTPSLRYTFTMTSFSVISSSNAGLQSSATILGHGTFADAGGTFAFNGDTSLSSMIFSLTDSTIGGGHSTSWSGTFLTTGPTRVPEPGTIGLLGLGIAAFAASRKSKKAA